MINANYQRAFEEIDFGPLKNKISEITGLSLKKLGLVFGLVEVRNGSHINMTSNDLVQETGIAELIFSKFRIETFNSKLTLKDDDVEQKEIWMTIHASYSHPGGGSNGSDIMTAWFVNGEWTFRIAGEKS